MFAIFIFLYRENEAVILGTLALIANMLHVVQWFFDLIPVML